MSVTARWMTATGGAALLVLSAAAAPAIADDEVKPVADKLEFVEAADGIKPFGEQDPAVAVAEAEVDGITIEVPDGGYAWSLPSKGEKDVLVEPSAAVE